MTPLTKTLHTPSKIFFFECRPATSFETFTGSVEHTRPEKFPRSHARLGDFFSENPRKQPDTKDLTRKATHGKYFLHSISSEHGKRSIRYHGPKIWDSVDNTLQRLSSILFRKRYRAHLISQYAQEDIAL